MSDQHSFINTLREQFVGKRVGPYVAWNKVSRTQIWQWCAAMGDTNALYLNQADLDQLGIAPPTMLQSWTFRDVHGRYAPGSTEQNTYQVLTELDELGYFGSVAVSYDQHYHAYLSEGDHVHSYSTIADISELKQTGLGAGCFVTEHAEYFNQRDELIGEAHITYLKYQPTQTSTSNPADSQANDPANNTSNSPSNTQRIPPVENHDSQHYWQGLRDGKLLLQQCSDCQSLRHPPQPMCEQCQSLHWHTLQSQCLGTIYSYTSIHYPDIPPFDNPNCIVLVDLDEGVRIAAQLQDTAYHDIAIGQRVMAHISAVQDNLSLPIFKRHTDTP